MQKPRAISIHCLGHFLNLSIQQAARQVIALRDALDFEADVIQLIAFSPKRQVLFQQFQQEIGKPLLGLGAPLPHPMESEDKSHRVSSSQLHSRPCRRHRTRWQDDRMSIHGMPQKCCPLCRSSPPPLTSTWLSSCLGICIRFNNNLISYKKKVLFSPNGKR